MSMGGVRGEDGVLGGEERGDLVLLEEQLSGSLAQLPRVVGWLGQQHRVVLGIHPEGLLESVVEQSLVELPVGHYVVAETSHHHSNHQLASPHTPLDSARWWRERIPRPSVRGLCSSMKSRRKARAVVPTK